MFGQEFWVMESLVHLFIQRYLNDAVDLNMVQNLIKPFTSDAVHTNLDDNGNSNLLAVNIYFLQGGDSPDFVIQMRQWVP